MCAFCANKLGAARTPSHVPRRHFQSAHPRLAEPLRAAEQEERTSEKAKNPAPSRNGGQKVEAGLGSWGLGLGGKAQGGLGNWGHSSTSTLSSTESSEPVHLRAASSQLLPHETRARQSLLDKQQKSTQHPMPNRHFGRGPQSTRAGRPVPRSVPTGWHQREERVAQSLEARDRLRDTNNQSKTVHMQRREPTGTGENSEPPRFTIRRQMFSGRNAFESKAVLNQGNLASRAEGQELESKESAWGSLRRKVEPRTPELSTSQLARQQREQQSDRVGYSPLSTASQSDGQRYQRQHMSRQKSDGFHQDQPIASSRTRFGRDVPLTRNQMRLREQPKEEVVESTFQSQTVNLDDDHIPAYAPPARERKKASRSGKYEAEEIGRGRGRDRDKARRRQHFASREEAEEEEAEGLARAEAKRLRKAQREAKKAETPTPILLPEFITIENLAVALKVRFEDFVTKLEDLGYEEVNRDYILNAENAGLIAGEYNFEAIIDRSESEDLKARDPAPDPSILPPRPPVVTIMGHVDHGKTTLLDYLRKSSVAAGEHGGITQHIGAFSVPMSGGKTITFLDTPGHAAFLSMRQRGANVTDIVILVVAADDSVKPQTIEAINHAKAAKVPIIVAINKIDKGDTNVQRVKQDLGRQGVELEDFGGDTQVVLVSGKTGQGMDELEEAAVTLSEILDMRAETDGPAEGWILEASIKSMGKVATVLVRRGTMRVGDYIVAGQTWARIRALRNEAGVEILEAGPGTPVEIDGWREQPLAGDEVLQAPDEAKAKSVVEYRLEKVERDKMAEDMEAVNASRKAEQEKREREKAEAAAREAALENGEEAVRAETGALGPKQIYFIVKADVSGSVEAVVDSLSILGNKEVEPNVIRSGVGQISEFDIEHAAAAAGYLINFNTTIEPNISQMAERAKVKILDHNIIYRLVDDVKATLSEYLPPLITQRVLGEAEVAQIFEIKLKGRQTKNIAGCKVRNGTISKTGRVRVLRNGEKVFDGKFVQPVVKIGLSSDICIGRLDSLKNVKKEVSEMKKGTECGMGFLDWQDFQVGDQIQTYEQIEEKRYL